MIKDYFTYIKESVEEEKFKIGDLVIINGIVDDTGFDNQPDTIDDISEDRVDTNMDKNGQCDMYPYKGITYHMAEAQWWVSPYNLKKGNYKRVFSKEDPYGEENWDKETNEAKKVKGEEILMPLMGNEFQLGVNHSIRDIMGGRMNEIGRNVVIDLLGKTRGKKVWFVNTKLGKNLKKERISEGFYWMEDRENGWLGWSLMMIGTKKDYFVNVTRQIGYYTEGEKYKRTISPLDPYGEEVWD